MDRKFGIELELVGITREQAGRALSQVGIEVHDEGYNHTTRSYWKMVSDSSVRGGFELVIPVLRGEDGIHEARKVATALDDMGATANRSCGYHVHLDAADLTASDIRAIVIRDVMTKTPKTVKADAMAAAAARILEESLVNQLLVTDDEGRLTGALHLHDLMSAKVI